MTDLYHYIRSQSVYSKLAEKPIVGQHGSLRLVFIHGYPMTLRGFYVLCSRAIFGSTLPLSPKTWIELNAETKLLTAQLGFKLEEGREALSVVDGIRAAAQWNKESASKQIQWQFDRDFLFKWVESVEEQIAALSGLDLPGPRLQ
jgi:hypothetical protein